MIKWYQTQGPDNGIVLSSRIRLARNIVDFPFHSKISFEQREQLNQKVAAALEEYQSGREQAAVL